MTVSTSSIGVPRHVAIVPDGNGRWAQLRGLPRSAGHQAGIDVFNPLVLAALDQGIKYVTFYAWSTENWNRPREEAALAFDLYENLLRSSLSTYIHHGICLVHVGRSDFLPPSLARTLQEIETATAAGGEITVQMAVDYGGRSEIADAAKGIARAVAAGTLDPNDVDERTFARFLYAPHVPDVDLFIRTSGEQRTSNFMPWQAVYAEMLFIKDLWPDITPEHLRAAVSEYAQRQRRFGGLTQPITI